jgi:hypothetical protein
MQLAANPNLRLHHIGLVVRAIEESLPLRCAVRLEVLPEYCQRCAGIPVLGAQCVAEPLCKTCIQTSAVELVM